MGILINCVESLNFVLKVKYLRLLFLSPLKSEFQIKDCFEERKKPKHFAPLSNFLFYAYIDVEHDMINVYKLMNDFYYQSVVLKTVFLRRKKPR